MGPLLRAGGHSAIVDIMQDLILHPDCTAGQIRSVSADIEPISGGCRARFDLSGDIGAIILPSHRQAQRENDLWKTTCFEIFWQEEGQDKYREFNLSPSSKWAAYDFDSFREGMRDAAVGSMSITMSHGGEELTLEVAIGSDLPLPAQIALNAVIEDKQGNIQYWALAFPDGKAEFHSATCRILRLEN